MENELKKVLEKAVETMVLADILRILSKVCYEKAKRIGDWRTNTLARAWRVDAEALELFADGEI